MPVPRTGHSADGQDQHVWPVRWVLIMSLILNVLFLVVNIYWLVLAFNGRVADWFKAAR